MIFLVFLLPLVDARAAGCAAPLSQPVPLQPKKYSTHIDDSRKLRDEIDELKSLLAQNSKKYDDDLRRLRQEHDQLKLKHDQLNTRYDQLSTNQVQVKAHNEQLTSQLAKLTKSTQDEIAGLRVQEQRLAEELALARKEHITQLRKEAQAKRSAAQSRALALTLFREYAAKLEDDVVALLERNQGRDAYTVSSKGAGRVTVVSRATGDEIEATVDQNGRVLIDGLQLNLDTRGDSQLAFETFPLHDVILPDNVLA